MLDREVFYENHPDPMWVCDVQSLRLLDVNRAAIETYGYSREEFLSLDLIAMRAPEDVPEFLTRFKDAVSQRYLSGTFRHRKKSGQCFFVHLTSHPIDWQGTPARLVAIRDIDRAVAFEHEREEIVRRADALRLEAEAAAARLAEQNSSLRTAQRLIGMSVWKYETWSNRLIWSPEIYRMYGVEMSNFPGGFDAYVGFVHPDDRSAMRDNYDSFIRSDRTEFDFAHRIVRPDGQVIHVRGVGEMHETPEGKMVVGVIQDVTKQVEQDNRLRLLDLSVSRLNDIVLIVEACPEARVLDARFVYVNAAFTRVTGVEEAEVLGETLLSVMRRVTPDIDPETLEHGLGQATSVRADLSLLTVDGRVLPAEIDLVPVRGPDGKMTHWVAVMREMSEKQDADARARLNEERYQMLSRSTQDVVWDWDVQTGVLTWNDNFRRLTGNPEMPLINTLASWSDRLHTEDQARVVKGFHDAIAGTGETWSDEYRFQRDDGEVRFVFDRGYISRDARGRGLRIVGSMVDVTNQKIADARLLQAEKLDALGKMTGGVAHDFNNLLTVIMGNTETLLDRCENPRDRRLLELVSSAAERGRDLTGRLLTFARRMPLKPAIVSVDEQVQRAAELLRRTFRSNVMIELDLGSPVSAIEADPGQLELVLLNLAINARDSMPSGGALTMSTQPVAAGGVISGFADSAPVEADSVVLSVIDTGTGMDSDTLRRCLEPFFTKKPVGRGVGLGLSMAFGFMEQTGGRLLISSEPGRGTRVALVFPESRQTVSGQTDGVAPSPFGGSEQILVVDDDAGVRDHLARVLTDLGYGVIVLENPDAAIAYLRSGGRADLLLTDIMMPGSAGVRQLVAEAQAMLPEIQVLYSTGYPRELIDLDGRLPEGIHLLPKPYRRSELALMVREVLDRAYAGPVSPAEEAAG